jgi:hypothetical protein
MKDTRNPLRIYFNVSLFVLILDLINLCVRTRNVKDYHGVMADLNWISTHKFMIIIGLLIFIYFYSHKRLAAWYTLMVIFLFTLPMLFLMDFGEISKISPTNILVMLSICWVLACSSLLFKYKNYKKYIKDIS